MKVFLFSPAVALLLGIAGWNTSRNTRAWLTSAFGISTGNRPDEDAYFGAAQIALDRWLLSQGYAAGTLVATPAAGMHSGTESSTAYRSSPNAAEPVTVIVTRETGTSSGLNANVYWEYSGFRWTVERHESLARESIVPISRWWKDYQEKHPRP